jgi:hypothetical protein
MKLFRKTIFLAPALAAFAPSQLLACAACYGRSDDPMAYGFNWAILTMFGILIAVLGTVATFFVFIIRKESALAAKLDAENFPQDKA